MKYILYLFFLKVLKNDSESVEEKCNFNNLLLSETAISWDTMSIEMDEDNRESWISFESVIT